MTIQEMGIFPNSTIDKFYPGGEGINALNFTEDYLHLYNSCLFSIQNHEAIIFNQFDSDTKSYPTNIEHVPNQLYSIGMNYNLVDGKNLIIRTDKAISSELHSQYISAIMFSYFGDIESSYDTMTTGTATILFIERSYFELDQIIQIHSIPFMPYNEIKELITEKLMILDDYISNNGSIPEQCESATMYKCKNCIHTNICHNRKLDYV